MNFINLTPHVVTVIQVNGEAKIFQPSGEVARLQTIPHFVDQFGFRFASQIFGDVMGVPEPTENTIFIVSTLIAQTLKRADVVSPDTGPTAVRENGQVKAVRGFQRF